MPDAENHALPPATNDSWRAWLSTGARRAPADRRRLRGAHRGLKQMLLEGMANDVDRPHAWKDFSGAMIRHAVDDAMRSLPLEDKQVVKLAYFGGYSNREIADQVGLTEATVQRRLRRALRSISDHIQHGRTLGRRAAYALVVWLSGRWLCDSSHHLAQVAVLASVTVIAAQPVAVPPSVVTSPAPLQVQAAQVHPQGHTPGQISAPPAAPMVPAPVAAQTPSVTLPVAIPTVPPLPPLPVKVDPPKL